MHSVTVATFDVQNLRRTRVSSAKEESYPLDACVLTKYGLYFRASSAGGGWRALEAHVLSALDLQVVRFDWREGEGYDYDYYLDVVRVVEAGEGRWVVRDLYLDLVVYEGERAVVLDTDEYLAALREGHLDDDEREHALTVTHETLNGLAGCGYSLERFLLERGVTLDWKR